MSISAMSTATPTAASAPVYPALPPLPPVYTAPDPLYQEKVAYSNALQLGAKVTETAARSMFDSYLKHIESGSGKEGVFAPDDDIEDSAPLRRNVMTAFKTMLETIDPTVQVIVADEKSCSVKLRDQPGPAKPAFVGFLNDQLLRLQVGSKIWLRNDVGSSTYKLAQLTKFTISKETYSGHGTAAYTDTGKEADFYWGCGYSHPLVDSKAVFLPCWDQAESMARLKEFFTLIPPTSSSSSRQLEVNDCVCVQDTSNKVWLSQVIDSSDTQVKVHYYGWDDKWDEWVDRTSDRIKRKLDLSKGEIAVVSGVSAQMQRFLKAFACYAIDSSYDKIDSFLKSLNHESITFFLLDATRAVPSKQALQRSDPFAVLTFGSYHLSMYCKDSKFPPNCEWQVQCV